MRDAHREFETIERSFRIRLRREHERGIARVEEIVHHGTDRDAQGDRDDDRDQEGIHAWNSGRSTVYGATLLKTNCCPITSVLNSSSDTDAGNCTPSFWWPGGEDDSVTVTNS